MPKLLKTFLIYTLIFSTILANSCFASGLTPVPSQSLLPTMHQVLPFIYDGDRIIEERDSANQLIASYVYGSGIDEILKMRRNDADYYYHYDGLGSVSDITDLNGYVLENYSYDVYGQPSQLSMIGNRNYFTGREYDAETGLYYYRARYYSPSIGRFLQRDLYTWGADDIRNLRRISNDMILRTAITTMGYIPRSLLESISDNSNNNRLGIFNSGSGNPSLLNIYSYTANNPVNFVDPSGFLNILIGGGGSAIGITGAEGSAGILINPGFGESQADLGIFGSAAAGGGVNVSADVFIGFIKGKTCAVAGESYNITMTGGPISISFLFDTVTGEFKGLTLGFGAGATPIGSSGTFGYTLVGTLRSLFN